MANIVVIGMQWGDEGKGKIVDLLTEFADVVVRFQGGNNAGHTVVVGEQSFVLHLVPSGALYPDKMCVIGNGVVVDPQVLLEEIGELRHRGYFQKDHQLLISEDAHLIMPYHKRIDLARERMKGEGKIGTTGRGIGPAYEDKIGRQGIRVGDLLDEETFREKLESNWEMKNTCLETCLHDQGFDREDVFREYRKYAAQLQNSVGNVSVFLDRQIREGKHILFEGAQGTHLDVDHGTYPYVTSSNTVAGGACTGAGIGPTRITEVIGVSKAYTTRVGGGPFPTELTDETGAAIRARGREFGATTGRPRRCGWLDIPLLRDTIRLNGLTGIALTKIDVLGGFETIRICTAYRYRGQILREVPSATKVLKACEPVWEEVPGWKAGLNQCREFEDLPGPTRDYVHRLEDLAGAEIMLVSVGERREETILRRNPFREGPPD
ncbi:MAG: adenylosuccinate synthase [Deltaproteobacteria bacterium]|nr:adenylosuccinate synthase [Deltaproteobacteria bacterium]